MGSDLPSFKINNLNKRDLSFDISRAIEKIELFSDQFLNDEQNIFKSPLHFAKECAKSFIKIKKNESFKDQKDEELLKAIRTIQKNYFFIQKLKKGTAKEQLLADSAIKVIERYNHTLQEIKRESLSLTTLFKNFMYKRWGISLSEIRKKEFIPLPTEAFVQFQNLKGTEKREEEKISERASLFFKGNEPISQHEADAFRAKAVSLLKNEGRIIGFNTLKEEFQTIRSTPIQAMVRKEELKVIMAQVIKPFPGEMIAFSGEFQRNNNFSTPLKTSFKIFTESHQTGYPRPTQHTGFALDECMIPVCPIEVSRYKKFLSLFEMKQNIKQGLLPQGKWIVKAKEILKLKKQVFKENQELLLEKLVELHVALLDCALEKGSLKREESLLIIFAFFEEVKKQTDPLSYLGESYETLLEDFIKKPFEKVRDTLIEQNFFIYSEEVQEGAAPFRKILEEEQAKMGFVLIACEGIDCEKHTNGKPESEIKKEQFIYLMGTIFSEAANSILLQHLSETIGFTAPKLTLFEQKVQASLYGQLIAFHEELLLENFDNSLLLDQFFRKIKGDLAIFRAKSLDEIIMPLQEVVLELENYYSTDFLQATISPTPS